MASPNPITATTTPPGPRGAYQGLLTKLHRMAPKVARMPGDTLQITPAPPSETTVPVGPMQRLQSFLQKNLRPTVPPAPPAPPQAPKPASRRPTAPPHPEAPKRHVDGTGPLVQYRARGNAVRVIQRRLQQLGFAPGPVNGIMGKKTVQAVKAFQKKEGLAADGVVGTRTWNELEVVGKGKVHYPAPKGAALSQRLMKHLANAYRGATHQCFNYAWTLVTQSGGRGLGQSHVSHAGRNQPITHLQGMIRRGELKVGDVVYANRQPGADPTSTNLAYGPHWFVYIGHGQFADQYGVRGASAMQAFVPGRKLDTIYHTFS